MKKMLGVALLGASIVATAPAEAVTYVTLTRGFVDNGDGTGYVSLGSYVPPVGEFEITYQFVTPVGVLTSSGNSASTRATTDVDFSEVFLNSIEGVVLNEDGFVGNSVWMWPTDALAPTVANIQTLIVRGVQYGTGRVTGEVAFAAITVPEPATWALMAAGFGLVGFAMRNRRRVAFAA